jgi:hypothetical protein
MVLNKVQFYATITRMIDRANELYFQRGRMLSVESLDRLARISSILYGILDALQSDDADPMAVTLELSACEELESWIVYFGNNDISEFNRYIYLAI